MTGLSTDPRATAFGFISIAIWGLATLFIHITRALPAFEVLAIGFAIGAVVLLLWGRLSTAGYAFLRQPWHYYAVAVTLLFVNNAAFILGLRHAPIVTASLINYLWPLLIVLLSAPILGRALRWWHACGAVLGFGGCFWLISEGSIAGFFAMLSADDWAGYLSAFIGAVSWAVYSLMLRRFYPQVPTQALSAVFAGVAVLCCMTALLIGGEDWRWPSRVELAAVTGIGVGVLGLAYACWDYGARRGDVRVMGVASYLTPVLSTLVLAQVGGVAVGPQAWAACTLVVAGALVGSMRELFPSRFVKV